MITYLESNKSDLTSGTLSDVEVVDNELVVSSGKTEGYRISSIIDISTVERFKSSIIQWEGEDVSVQTCVSYDGGVTWTPWEYVGSDGFIPGFYDQWSLDSMKLMVKEILETSAASLNYLIVQIETVQEDPYLVLLREEENIIKDTEMDVYDGYMEETKIRNLDIHLIEDNRTLIQAIEGELKTPKGSVEAYGLENYGSQLDELLGQLQIDLIYKTAEFYVGEVVNTYSQVLNWSIEFDKSDRTVLRFTLKLDTIYGEVIKDVEVG